MRIVVGIGELRLVVGVDSFHFGRDEAMADELVNGGQQETRIAGELLGQVGAAARGEHSADVVYAEILLNEIARALTNELTAARVHVQVVEHDHIHTPRGGLTVGAHVRGDGLAAHQHRRLPFERYFDKGERVQLLKLTVLKNLKV